MSTLTLRHKSTETKSRDQTSQARSDRQPGIVADIALGMKEIDKDKRFVIYKELQNLIQEDVPLVTIYSEKNLIALNKAIEGRGCTIYGMHYDVNEWSIKQ
ncbi:hypothetical protein EXW96_24665 [Paenibacillus sp. JMULE4]|uniref:hypothetical protein n=1 Tax=Paenibacillus sp. JMULE4 TaxID=2518342 RepID=UPI001575357D|nr:hypothetical protein [Paenibacillus sp. JMULE4]NTZ20591.1 hypothetical protein [Paenibacillus sp. JMULE4]